MLSVPNLTGLMTTNYQGREEGVFICLKGKTGWEDVEEFPFMGEQLKWLKLYLEMDEESAEIIHVMIKERVDQCDIILLPATDTLSGRTSRFSPL